MKKTEPALPPKKCLPFGWVVKTSRTYPDRVYYFNTRTNASSWEQPTLVSQKEYLSSVPPDELNKKLQKSGVVPITPIKISKPPKYSQDSSGLGEEDFSPSYTDSDGPSQSDTDAEEPSLTDFQKKILEKEEEETDLENITSEQDNQDIPKQLKAETNSKFNVFNDLEQSSTDTDTTLRKCSKSNSSFSVALNSIKGNYSEDSSIHSSQQKVDQIPRKPQKRKLDNDLSIHPSSNLSFSVCGTLNSLKKQNSHEQYSPKSKKKYSPIKFVLKTDQSSSNLDSVHIPSSTSLERLNCKLRLGQCSGDDLTLKRTVINQSESITESKRFEQDFDTVKVYIQDNCERQIEQSDKRHVLSGSDLRLKLIKKKDGSEHDNSENSDLPAPKKHQIQNWINSISETEPLTTDFPPSPVSKTSSKSDDSTMMTGSKDRRVILTFDHQPTDSGYSSKSSVTTTIQPTPLLITSTIGIDSHFGPETPVTLGEDEEEEMEIDEQEEEMMIVDLQEVRGEVSAIPELAIGTLTKQDSESNLVQEEHKDRLFIIIDTNILIQSLKFLQNLTETIITNFGLPFIVIPWVVMQELDFIKDGKSKHTVSQVTKFQAMKAVKFLYSCLQNKHPRVLGQTASDSRLILDNFTIECNDDRVLQCCFSYTHKYPNSKIVLLSDDFNLCNKATISDISAFTKDDLFNGLAALNGTVANKPVTKTIQKESQLKKKKILNKITKLSTETVVPKPSHKTSVKTVPKQPLSQSNERKLIDEILCSVKEEIKRSLSVVLETEMKSAYHNIWKCIVLRKPPWSALDIMESIQKHWIGVFGLVLDRRKKTVVDNIVTSLRCKTVRDLEVLETLIQHIIEFLTVCEKRERYNGVLEESKSNLNKLLLKCQPKTVTFTTPDEPESLVQSQTEESEEDLLNSVQDRFQVIWSAIHDCSDNLPNLENPTSILQLIIPVITELRHQFALCLSISPTNISNQRLHFESFTHSLNSFFSKMQADSPKPISSQALIAFFSIPVKRQTLASGLEQLDQMICKFHAYIQMM